MSNNQLLINFLNRKGLRSILAKIFEAACYYKTGFANKIYFDKDESLWVHKYNGIYFYVYPGPSYINYYSLVKSANKVSLFGYSLKDQDTIIDIGAGVGTETLVYSKAVSDTGRVYAIEPHPLTFRCLDYMCRLNKLKNVTLSCVAIGGRSGTAKVSDMDNPAQNYTLEANGGIEVQSLTLDQYVTENRIKKINFLKMNIEGGEKSAIPGMKQSISIIDNIAISCHDFIPGISENNRYKIKEAVIDFLKSNDFEIMLKQTGNIILDSWVYAKKKKPKIFCLNIHSYDLKICKL